MAEIAAPATAGRMVRFFWQPLGIDDPAVPKTRGYARAAAVILIGSAWPPMALVLAM
ncbi:hypothetical protein [Streptomyces sp. NPDC051001]|uniref:hypothetical protein n=1 Tax=Streptomyces sp. NPDC051001 TaxID=3155795 RepID=UPI00341A5778